MAGIKETSITSPDCFWHLCTEVSHLHTHPTVALTKNTFHKPDRWGTHTRTHTRFCGLLSSTTCGPFSPMHTHYMRSQRVTLLSLMHTQHMRLRPVPWDISVTESA
jgi:hypothetical protein